MGSDIEIASAFEGGCHCGALRFTYRTRVAPSAWSIRACQCSFCRAHQGITTSDPEGVIEFNEVAPDSLTRYRFGQGSADFLICSHCGVYIGVVMSAEGGTWGIINTNSLRIVPAEMAEPQRKNFSEETLEQRIARRKQVWSRAIVAAV